MTVRETALITALTTRKDALIAAWALTEKASRNNAIQAAWTAYRSARKSTWKTYKDTARKTCKISELGADSGAGDSE